MYAIVEIAGQQFKVEKDQKYFVHQLDAKPGSKVTFENVLLLDDKGKVTVGSPSVNGVEVTAKIEQHLLGDKVIVFKKKRRKGYAVKNGHRQRLTEITVQEIGKKSATKKTTPKAEAKKVVSKEVAPKTEAKKVAVKKAAPKTEAKKVSVKKAAAKKITPKAESKKATSSKSDK
jgi:large subunit ribosomal protein L21